MSRRSSAKSASVPESGHELTPTERDALEVVRQRKADRVPVPCVKLTKSGKGPGVVDFDHPDAAVATTLLMRALGTANPAFLSGILGQAVNVATKGREIDVPASNFMLAAMAGAAPQDDVEAMLAAQMAAVHLASMTFARRLAHVENLPQQDSAARAFNQLTRTFTMQVDALKRYRTGGQQKVRVEHVTVNEGGQAIVGNVTREGRGKD